MDKYIKHTSIIKLNVFSFKCYTTEDNSMYFGTDVERIFKTKPNIEQVTLFDPQKQTEVDAYEIGEAIDNIKTSYVRSFALIGIDYLIKDRRIEAQEEPELSSFDKLIKKALDFNPNK